MRKGLSLVEVLVVIAAVFLISVPLARLSTATLRDIPACRRMIETNTTILNAIEQIRKDVNAAKKFPESFGTYTANGETLLIELENETVLYQLKDGRILRQKFTKTGTDTEKEITTWRVPNGGIQWRLWRRNGRRGAPQTRNRAFGDPGYAVEIKTWIEQKSLGRLEKKMANSYLYFAGAHQEAVK